jgi:hypothetical protein
MSDKLEEKKMKKLLLGLLVLGSISSFAATDCTYFAKEVGGAIDNSLSQKAFKTVKKKMSKKGYKRVFDQRDATYTLEFSADWRRGPWNGMDNVYCGDSEATVKLYSNSDGRVKAQGKREGVAGYLCGIAKDAKANNLLIKTFSVVPNCSEL